MAAPLTEGASRAFSILFDLRDQFEQADLPQESTSTGRFGTSIGVYIW
jgi:hypothetical protein